MIRKLITAAVLVVLTIAAAWPGVAGAQEWKLSVDAGRMRSTVDPTASGSRTVAAAADYESPLSAFRLSIGVPTQSDPLRWGAIAGFKRLATTHGRFTEGLDLSGSAFLFRATGLVEQPGGGLLGLVPQPGDRTVITTGRAVAAQALPMVGVQAGPVQLQARAGVSYYDATTRSDARDRVAALAELQLPVRAAPAAVVAPLVRWVAPRGEPSASFAGLSGIVSAGPIRLSAQSGRWFGGIEVADSNRTSWFVGGAVRVASRASLTAGARRDAMDPAYRNTPGTSWSIGASFLLHARSRAGIAPVASRDARGVATITLQAAQASAPPRIAGDFNGWTPEPMQRDGSVWRHRVAASPGVYNYAFVTPEGDWYVPEGTAGRKDDGMGGHVAVVVIQ